MADVKGWWAKNWWIVGIFVILIIVIILWATGVFSGSEDEGEEAGVRPETPQGGLGETIAGLLTGIPIGDWLGALFSKCDPNNKGYDTNGKPRKKCGASNYTLNNCDPDKKGYNKNGVLDPSCGGTGSGVCNPFECDPNRAGYNMCGDKGFPCD